MICSKKFNCAYASIKNIYQKYVNFLENYLSSILLLAVRIWISLIFIKSGLTKFSNLDSAIMLFEYEYSLPFLSPKFAAASSMFFEIASSAALLLGFLTRIATFPLIAITLVIQIMVFQNQEHFYWLFLLSTLAIYGGGLLSIDTLIRTRSKTQQ